MIALYDMRRRLSTYDYFNWQAHVRVLGATGISFRIRDMVSTKWPVAEARRRFWNYIWPGPSFLGMERQISDDGEEVGSHMMCDLAEDMKQRGVDLPRMESTIPPATERYTVTLRETFFKTWKNSDVRMWIEFAERIRARIVRDHSVEPIKLAERIALYAGARMNFGVPNGPVSMIWYTPYPLTMFCDPETTAKSFGGHKIRPGEQVPWMLSNQKLVWERPTMRNLLHEFEMVR